ncbi:ParA family protein [Cyanobacteria bacterium FACHB-63]|nr:ParA family protein [Cyanobacteria bacterium FACHB-63]
MGSVIALFNMSGGVGKSTLTMNLGYHLSQDHQKRVLMVDMDPQASLTTFVGFSPFDMEKTVQQAMLAREPLPILQELGWADLVPANIFLSQAELRLSSELRREYRLADALEKVRHEYDVILLDCPPSLGLLSVNCLVASDYLLIPIQAEYKSVEATINLLQVTYETAQQVNPKLRVVGAVPTMYDERTKQSQRALEAISEMFESIRGNKFFEKTTVFQPIPRRTHFANATAEHQVLAQFAPKLVDAIRPLQEITQRLGALT